ncbi:MAG: hypothetical protein Ct9H300mP6_19410 [Gammaproteobacteria bacterium]|nr:MAG: hypothetical protein Ct9H300mP6_19410 [Gammaproteobacteria bacterium]
MTNNIRIIPTLSSEEQEILNPKTLELIKLLHTKFNPKKIGAISSEEA